MSRDPWFVCTLTAFDLETTGVATKTDRIVTGYVGHLHPAREGGHVEVGATVLINPGVEIPEAAARVHGITTEQAQAHGCDPRDGVNSIAEALAYSLRRGWPVVGFNLAYDLTMLHYECIRHGVATLAQRLDCAPDGIAPIIDAHVLDKATDTYRKGSRMLDATCAHYGITLGNVHEAKTDAIGAARLAYKIGIKYYDEVGSVPVDRLHDEQVRWKRAQAVSFQRHLRTKAGGDPAAVVDPCWPVCIDPDH